MKSWGGKGRSEAGLGRMGCFHLSALGCGMRGQNEGKQGIHKSGKREGLPDYDQLQLNQ